MISKSKIIINKYLILIKLVQIFESYEFFKCILTILLSLCTLFCLFLIKPSLLKLNELIYLTTIICKWKKDYFLIENYLLIIVSLPLTLFLYIWNYYSFKCKEFFIVPMNPFSKTNRFITCVIYAAYIHSILKIFQFSVINSSNNSNLTSNNYFNTLFQEGVLINLCLRILNVFVIGFQFYPILLCIEFKFKSKLAFLLSSMYAWLICLYYIISNELYCKEITTINYFSLIFENYLNKNLLIIDYNHDDDDDELRSISFRIEKVMFYFILSLIGMTLSIDFILLLLMEIIDYKYKTNNTDGLIATKYTKWKLSNHNNNNSWLNSYYCKYFKFTKQFLNINVISFVLLMNSSIFIINQSSQLSQLLAILIVNILKQIFNEYINNSIATIDLITKHINDILIKSCLLTTFIYILQLFFNIKTYKTNVLKAYRGEYKLKLNKYSTTKLTCCSLHYPSYSIGVLLIGYFVLFYFNLFVIFLLQICIQIRLIQLDLFKYILPVIIMFVLKRILVFCVCRYLLFSSKSSYAIKNFKLYLLINHFNFFFDSFIIFFVSTLRIFYSFMASLLFFSRLDYKLFDLGLETYDMGYMSYVGFLCIEVYQTHPIKIAFCELLLIQNVNNNKNNKRKKAINKWCLAYTLIKNPSLIKYRRKLIFKH